MIIPDKYTADDGTEKNQSAELKLSESNNWSQTIHGLPTKSDETDVNGKKLNLNYFIIEDKVGSYTPSYTITGDTLTVTNTLETIELTAEKVWSNQTISLHAEVPAEGDILEVHDIIDNIENELRAKLGCDATIHMDPVVTSDEHISEMKAAVFSIIRGIDEIINIHDFRVVTGPTHTNLIFDVLVPYKFYISDEELTTMIEREVKRKLGNNHNVVLKVDKSYVQMGNKK